MNELLYNFSPHIQYLQIYLLIKDLLVSFRLTTNIILYFTVICVIYLFCEYISDIVLYNKISSFTTVESWLRRSKTFIVKFNTGRGRSGHSSASVQRRLSRSHLGSMFCRKEKPTSQHRTRADTFFWCFVAHL